MIASDKAELNTAISLRVLAGGAGSPDNAYVLQSAECQLLLDCGGSTANRAASWMPNLNCTPDVVWVSHAHLDHIGGLANIMEKFPSTVVIASSETRQLAADALQAAIGSEARAVAISKKIIALKALQPICLSEITSKVRPGKIEITLFPAGHVAGASSLLVSYRATERKPFNVFYTGDFSCHRQVTVAPAAFPVDDGGVDALIMESTLATDWAADQVDYESEIQRLKAVFSHSKVPRLLAVSLLGEACELAAALIQSNAPVIVHERLRAIFEVYRTRCFDEQQWRQLIFADMQKCRAYLQSGHVVIAPGDQLEKGSAAGELVFSCIDDHRAKIGFLNRVYPKTPAANLLNASQDERLSVGGVTVAKRAQVIHFVLPNHATRWQHLGTVNLLAPATTILVHGRKGGMHALQRALKKDGYTGHLAIPQNNEIVALRD